MTTVQLAIPNQQYAVALADLLRKDHSRQVRMVYTPDIRDEGIIVTDGGRPENLLLFEAEPERFVVIAHKDAGMLSRIWDAGVRHVVFEEDSPSTAVLAVIAAELRSPRRSESKSLPVMAGDERKRLRKFPAPVLNLPGCSCNCLLKIRKSL